MGEDKSSKNRSPVAILLLIVLGAVGLGVRSTSTPSKARTDDAPTTAPLAASSTPLPVHDPVKLLEYHLLSFPRGEAWKDPYELPEHLRGPNLEFLIATVPDPIDSRFGYRFDSVVDGVQVAVEGHDYYLDRFWLPWRPNGQQPQPKDALKPTIDPAATPSILHIREPGIMLFRPKKKDAEHPLKVVFLVGETPLSGLQKIPFIKALDVIDSYERSLPAPRSPRPIRIVGPFFSGSAHSMATALSGWIGEGGHATADSPRKSLIRLLAGDGLKSRLRRVALLRVLDSLEALDGSLPLPQSPSPGRDGISSLSRGARSLSTALSGWIGEGGHAIGSRRTILIRSGSASKIDERRLEEESLPKAERDRPTWQRRWKVEFASTVAPNDRVIGGLLDHLRVLNRGKKLGKIALLTESDTAYGNISASEASILSEHNVLRIEFPFHISQLRIAYDQGRAEASEALPSLARSSSKLKVPLDETGGPRDTLPSLSPRMTSVKDEFVLARILTTFSREDFRYVGILASDTRDVIFLSGLIREFCPDAQIFTTQGDLLLGHPDYANQLRGTLVASTYPLFSMAQRWSFPYEGDHRRHLFSHESEQGYYNATVSHLNEERAPGDDAARLEARMMDYGSPFEELHDESASPKRAGHLRRPPIWLSVVGQRGLWPLDYIDPNEEVGADVRKAGRGEDPKASYNRYVYGMDDDAWSRDRESRGRALKAQGREWGDWRDAAAEERRRRLAPMFTWLWAASFLAASTLVAWVAVIAMTKSSWRTGDEARGLRRLIAVGPAPGGFVGLFKFRRPALRHQQEANILGGLAVLTLLYAYFTQPCFVGLLPLQLTATGGTRPGLGHWLWSLIPAGDDLNGKFSLFAVVLSIATCLLAMAAMIARMRWYVAPDVALWGPDPGPIRLRRPTLAGLAALMAGVRPRALARGASRWWADMRADRRVVGAGLVALIVAVGVSVLFLWQAFRIPRAPGDSTNADHLEAVDRLAFERTVNLTSGVSPLVPALFLGASACCWFACHLRRLELLDRLTVEPPFAGETASKGGGIAHGIEALDYMLVCWRANRLGNPAFLLPLGVLALGLLKLLIGSPAPPIDGALYGTFAFYAIAIWSVGLFLSLYRYVLLWSLLRPLLRELARLPLMKAYARLPEVVSRTYGHYLDRAHSSLSRLTIHVQQWGAVALRLDEVRRSGRPLALETQGVTLRPVEGEKLARLTAAMRLDDASPDPDAARRIHDAFHQELEGARNWGEVARGATRRGLSEAARACIDILADTWPSAPLRDAYEAQPHTPADPVKAPASPAAWDLLAATNGNGNGNGNGSAGSATAVLTIKPVALADAKGDVQGEGSASWRWYQAAEELVALELVAFVGQYTAQIRNLATFLSAGPILMLMAAMSYPFQPQRYLMILMWSIVAVVVSSLIYVYIQINRDAFISHVARTTPDRITVDQTFVTTIAAYALPLVGIIVAQFPEISDLLNAWLGPMTGSSR